MHQSPNCIGPLLCGPCLLASGNDIVVFVFLTVSLYSLSEAELGPRQKSQTYPHTILGAAKGLTVEQLRVRRRLAAFHPTRVCVCKERGSAGKHRRPWATVTYSLLAAPPGVCCSFFLNRLAGRLGPQTETGVGCMGFLCWQLQPPSEGEAQKVCLLRVLARAPLSSAAPL